MSILPVLQYYWKAQTRYNVHSPFIYSFAENVLDDQRHFYAFEKLDRLRNQLLADTTLVPTPEYGAGSKNGQAPQRSIRELAKTVITPKPVGEILFKTVNHFGPTHILELGTALGMGTLYLALAAAQSATVYTLEANKDFTAIAQKHFDKLDATNITCVNGRFEEKLTVVLQKMDQLDLAFFDGHHTHQATLANFNLCLEKAHEKTVFIFDDINWSEDMHTAWEEIGQHPQVTYTVNLFRLGIAFFHPNKQGKSHYSLIPHRWKPWSVGFWG